MLYFKTFSNIHEDEKIIMLKEELGMAGFGRYMTLLALIAERRKDGKEEYTFTKSYLSQKMKKRWTGLQLEFDYSSTIVKVKYPKFAELNPYLSSKKKREERREKREEVKRDVVFDGGELSKKKVKPKVKKDSAFQDQIQEVIDHLNKKAGKRFTAETNKKFIIGRIKEGATVEEMKSVIDRKIKNDFFLSDNKRLMRPSTLFSKTNYENYSQEIPTRKPKDVFLAE